MQNKTLIEYLETQPRDEPAVIQVIMSEAGYTACELELISAENNGEVGLYAGIDETIGLQLAMAMISNADTLIKCAELIKARQTIDVETESLKLQKELCDEVIKQAGNVTNEKQC